MAKPKGAPIARIEINGPFREGDPVLEELRAEAAARNLTIQQHIYDILKSRHMARQGKSYMDLLWTPSDPATKPTAAAEPPPPADAAGQAAAAWLDLLEE